MSAIALCPRVTLTIQISEVLFDALQVTASMSRTTVDALIASVLRESEIGFFAEPLENGKVGQPRKNTPHRGNNTSPFRKGVEEVGLDKEESRSDCEVMVVASVRTDDPPRIRRVPGELGSLQRAILDHLLHAPATTSGVYDLREVRRTMLRSHSSPAMSRAVGQLVRRGVLEPVDAPVGTEVRYVRRGAGS